MYLTGTETGPEIFSFSVFQFFSFSVFQFFSFWGLADVQALTTDNRTVELLFNINTGDGTDPFWSNGEGDGNKFMEASTIFEIAVITNETAAFFSSVYQGPDSANRRTGQLFFLEIFL